MASRRIPIRLRTRSRFGSKKAAADELVHGGLAEQHRRLMAARGRCGLDRARKVGEEDEPADADTGGDRLREGRAVGRLTAENQKERRRARPRSEQSVGVVLENEQVVLASEEPTIHCRRSVLRVRPLGFWKVGMRYRKAGAGAARSSRSSASGSRPSSSQASPTTSAPKTVPVLQRPVVRRTLDEHPLQCRARAIGRGRRSPRRDPFVTKTRDGSTSCRAAIRSREGCVAR